MGCQAYKQKQPNNTSFSYATRLGLHVSCKLNSICLISCFAKVPKILSGFSDTFHSKRATQNGNAKQRRPFLTVSSFTKNSFRMFPFLLWFLVHFQKLILFSVLIIISPSACVYFQLPIYISTSRTARISSIQRSEALTPTSILY